MTLTEKKNKIFYKVYELIDIAECFYGNHIPIPNVKFSNKMKKVAGTALYDYQNNESEITLSIQIIEDNDFELFLKRTVFHEVAHIVTASVYREMKHDKQFRYVMMKVFGLPAELSTRCHNYNLRGKVVKKTVYIHECEGCGKLMILGKIRHKRHMERTTTYYDIECNHRLSRTEWYEEQIDVIKCV